MIFTLDYVAGVFPEHCNRLVDRQCYVGRLDWTLDPLVNSASSYDLLVSAAHLWISLWCTSWSHPSFPRLFKIADRLIFLAPIRFQKSGCFAALRRSPAKTENMEEGSVPLPHLATSISLSLPEMKQVGVLVYPLVI